MIEETFCMKNFLSKVFNLTGFGYVNLLFTVCENNLRATLRILFRKFYSKHKQNITCISQTCLFIGFLKKYYLYFISIVLFVVITFAANILVLLHAYNVHIAKQVNIVYNVHRNEQLEHVYPAHICKLVDCVGIYKGNTLIYSPYLVPASGTLCVSNLTRVGENIYIGQHQIAVGIPEYDLYVTVSYEDYSNLILYNFLTILFLLLIFESTILYKAYKRERSEALLQQVGTEAILSNKSMVMITENVHHELNTPIEIIDNKIEKIHRVITDYLVSENDWWMGNANLRVIPEEKRQNNKKMVKLEKDFEFIKTSIEQIFAVLNKMKNFKSLRYSNGDKTIYDIIDGAFKIIGISNSDFTYKIDEQFKNYRMSSLTFKNVDLINVLINHIKNSLEANSDRILVDISSTKEDMISILLSDNGNGIPEQLLNNIFEPNLSSKAIGSTIRGNGMYLNKHIIRDSGGDIRILSTSKDGTTIAVTIPVKYVEYEESFL